MTISVGVAVGRARRTRNGRAEIASRHSSIPRDETTSVQSGHAAQAAGKWLVFVVSPEQTEVALA